MRRLDALDWLLIAQSTLTAGALIWAVRELKRTRVQLPPAANVLAETQPEWRGDWDISPGETLLDDGTRDHVLEGSMESFPASDPPAYSPNE